MLGISDELGVELFDAGLASSWGVVAPVRLDIAALRSSGNVPAVLRTLVGPARRVVEAAGATSGGPAFAERLAVLPAGERDRLALELVRRNVAAVLGYDDAGAVAEDRAFKEIGFDSLTAVELRNRLNAATGLRLPATLVFDYPNPAVLAKQLLAEVLPDGADPGAGDEETALRSALASIPMTRLREAGVLGTLLALAGLGDDAEPETGGSRDDLDDLDAADLIRRALGATAS
ncbi:beta-ketoacyl reductase [Actinoplanes sp. NPDC049118]|uniref:acyl carrier protein n=1 Tax=Actinoplanes sp. NPDC049118 TaxID=3155769 RepID=UPI0033D2DE9B